MEGLAGYVEALQGGFVALCWVAIVCVPLALWKLIDILIWLCRHLHWS